MSEKLDRKEEYYWVSTAQIKEFNETVTKVITQPCTPNVLLHPVMGHNKEVRL